MLAVGAALAGLGPCGPRMIGDAPPFAAAKISLGWSGRGGGPAAGVAVAAAAGPAAGPAAFGGALAAAGPAAGSAGLALGFGLAGNGCPKPSAIV